MKTRRHGEHGEGERGFHFSFRFALRALRLCGYIFFCVAAQTAQAAKKPTAPPVPVTYSMPSAAAPGATTDITFDGAVAGDAVALWTSFPAEVTPLPSEGGKVRYRMKLAADAPVGIGAVRLATSKGISSFQLFMVDDLPTVMRAAGSLPLQHAQEISLPVAVDGACEPFGADCFAFVAKKGQRVSIDVVAGRLGSKMDPVVRLLDGEGRELAYCDDTPGAGSDCRFAYTFAADGRYIIELRDANYEGGNNHRYRLRIGDFPLVTSPFPLAAKRGISTRVDFAGADSDRLQPLKINLPADVQRALAGIKYLNGQGSGYVSVVGSDAEEIIASADTVTDLKVPALISGWLDKPGLQHRFSLLGHKGDHLSIRGRTRSVGSACELFLQLLKTNGAVLAASKPAGADEGMIDVTIPDDGQYVLTAEDVTGGGGPGMVYRLEIGRVDPGFSLSVETEKLDAVAGGKFTLKVKCVRRDYNGPIELSLEGLGSAFELKNQTIAKGKTETDVEAKVPSEVSGTQPMHFKVIGKAKIGEAEVIGTASTLPVLKRLFPRLAYPPPELDGMIGLGVRAGK